MRKIGIIVSIVLIVLLLPACGSGSHSHDSGLSSKDEKYVKKAILEVKKELKKRSADQPASDQMTDIINTRLIKIKENDSEYFEDVDCVVEFDILSNYYGSAPYYPSLMQYDTVVFYKDGTSKVLDLFNAVKARTYNTDFSDVIDSITECGNAFNTNKIKTKPVAGEKKELVEAAIEELKTVWTDIYEESGFAPKEGLLRIVRTTLIDINPDIQDDKLERYFEDIDAIVEFVLYTNEIYEKPYTANTGYRRTAVIHKDGRIEITNDYIGQVRGRTYITDYSGVISEIHEIGSQFNKEYHL